MGLQNRAQGRLLGLHKDHQTGQGLPSQDVFKSLFFPGRLSSSSRIPGRAEQNVSPGVNPVQRSRVFSQQGEINHFSQPKSRVLRSNFPFRLSQTISPTEKSGEDSEVVQGDVSPISYNHETTGGSVGPSEFCVIPGPSREASSETTPALDESPYFFRIKGQIRGFRKVFQKGFGNLANITVPSDSSSDVSTSSVPSKLMTDASS